MNEMLVNIQNLCFSYEKRENEILHDISFHVSHGESIGIIGSNGSGKSTLLKVIAGLYPDFKGQIKIQDIEVVKKNVNCIQQQLGYIFQDVDSQLFLSTVEEELCFGPMNQGLSKSLVKERVQKTAEILGLDSLRDRQISKLSGGEKRLVSLGCVLTMNPLLLLMDEPTTALDSKNRRNFIRLFQSLEQTKIMVSHDLDLILETCKRTILLHKGSVICDMDTVSLLKNEELLVKYDLELPYALQKK